MVSTCVCSSVHLLVRRSPLRSSDGIVASRAGETLPRDASTIRGGRCHCPRALQRLALDRIYALPIDRHDRPTDRPTDHPSARYSRRRRRQLLSPCHRRLVCDATPSRGDVHGRSSWSSRWMAHRGQSSSMVDARPTDDPVRPRREALRLQLPVWNSKARGGGCSGSGGRTSTT